MLLKEIKLSDSIKYHPELSDKLWTSGNVLKKEVKEALDKIASEFIETLGVDTDAVVDIIITGSMVNYNYTKYSDIDLHVVIDYKNLCKDCVKFSVADCMDAKRSLWNERHDITIYGLDVELYVHDSTDKITGNAGVYSIKNNRWLRLPKKETDVEYDGNLIRRKAESLMNQIDSVIEYGTSDNISDLQKKIRNARKSGLEKHGEYSPENLAFKLIRNAGYMDKLYKAGQNKTDDELSLK